MEREIVFEKELGGCKLSVRRQKSAYSDDVIIAVFTVWPQGTYPIEVRAETSHGQRGCSIKAQLDILIKKAAENSSSHVRSKIPVLKSMAAEYQGGNT